MRRLVGAVALLVVTATGATAAERVDVDSPRDAPRVPLVGRPSARETIVDSPRDAPRVPLVGRPSARETIAGVLHVHSTLSTGALSLDELAQLAARQGIGAILLSENYLLEFEYGLPPFRAFTRVVRGGPGVLESGIDRYFADVAAAQRRTPNVVLVRGVEVVPHYRWTGSPLALEMTLSDTQKNLLVFGIRDAATLERLPTIGNPYAAEYGWQSVLDAIPVALVVPGVALIAWKQTRRIRVGRAVAIVRRRRWMLGLVVLAVGVAAFVRAWPFRVDRHPSWTDAGLAPHQELIDYVERAGGTAVWSFPEARDEGEQKIGIVRVRHRTAPYPDDLLRTVRYTAFGAVYEDTTGFERAGAGWDRMLSQYVAGERSRPAWAVGESGFHEFRADKRPINVQTVFLEAERSEAGVLDALKHGRMYALRRTSEFGLQLGEFAVTAAGATVATGDTLRAPADSDVEVRIGVTTSNGDAHPVRVTLVRNGVVVSAWAATTPFRVVHRDRLDTARTYYRLDVRGDRPHQLLTNPIFLAAS